MWYVNLSPQPLLFDQGEYLQTARHMQLLPYYTNSIRPYGYPLLLSWLFDATGTENPLIWKSIQCAMDSMTAILVILIGFRVFRKNIPAFVAGVLYLVNPFTSAYAGILLTEVLTVFLITLSIYLLVINYYGKKLVIYLIISFILGFIPQVRSVFLFWSLVNLSWIMFRIFRTNDTVRKKILQPIAIFFVFLLPFFYSMAGNYIWYRTLTPFTPDNQFVLNLYISLYIKRVTPDMLRFPEEVDQANGAFTRISNSEERRVIENKYSNLTRDYITHNPVPFLESRLEKMEYVWEKNTWFPLTGYRDSSHILIIRWINRILLGSSFVGFVLFLRRQKKSASRLDRFFVIQSVILIILLTLYHTVTTAEERYSLPGYPILFLFTGWTVYEIYCRIRGKLC